MRTIHGWDCLQCATRNAPAFVHCRRCDAPQSQGRPVAGDDPAYAPRVPVRSEARMSSEVAGCLWKMGFAVGIPLLAYFCLGIPLWVWPVLAGAAIFCTPWYFWAAYFGLKRLDSIERRLNR